MSEPYKTFTIAVSSCDQCPKLCSQAAPRGYFRATDFFCKYYSSTSLNDGIAIYEQNRHELTTCPMLTLSKGDFSMIDDARADESWLRYKAKTGLNKIEKAVYDYSLAVLNIKETSRLISEKISECQENVYTKRINFPYSSHLRPAYEMAFDDDIGDVDHVNGDPEEYLKENCAYCLEAHRLIQVRKKQRAHLGAIRGVITKLGKGIANRHGVLTNGQ